ncbi:MAG: beta-galactosidase, partial [Verrucomicrobia bacterium]|nr:beta-galactosidase [Verrucomicrobiota bacterium]
MNHPRSRSLPGRSFPAVVLLILFSLLGVGLRGATAPQDGPVTERQYLSGHGPADAVPWEFTVTGGRRANEATTIPVPSHWEQHGFGTYNYGQEPRKGDERGLYRTRFAVPAAWRGRRIRLVFDGVMTDTAVKINGRSAGPVHQGGFYRFSYDITSLVKPTAGGTEPENLLEVDVSKVSANPDTERAERGGDYWVFGGIYRPVYLESVPAQSIARVAIDARSDGAFSADVVLSYVSTGDRVEAQIVGADGRPVGAPLAAAIPGGGVGSVRLTARIDRPELWTAETPRLYSLRLTLRRGEETLHTIAQRFGFRTFEVRAGAGLFLNGQRILLKGVNRHSFRPETGRALTRDDCYADVRLIKAMNMNAVRMSHYPPDVDFLEACDELGLYVLDELSGWQHAHDTAVGRLLVRELVERDVNHPSILFWDNGNEGGFNRDLDGEFALYDPQRRRVLHPWDPFSGIDTKHYLPFDDLLRRLRGPNLVMPTEFLHGLYDGGMGAGLADYW